MRLHDYLSLNARENPEGEFALDSSRGLTNAAGLAEANQLANAFVAAGRSDVASDRLGSTSGTVAEPLGLAPQAPSSAARPSIASRSGDESVGR